MIGSLARIGELALCFSADDNSSFVWEFLSRFWNLQRADLDSKMLKNILVGLNSLDPEATQNFIAKVIAKGSMHHRMLSLELFLSVWTLHSIF